MLKNIKRKIKKILTLGIKKTAIAKHFKSYLIDDDNFRDYTYNYLFTPEHVEIPESIYYSPVKDKFYFSKDYSPLGKIANKTFYEYIGEL